MSVVVVNYLRWPDTVSLIRGLRESELLQKGGAEIIVIDNNSPEDGLVKDLRRWDGVTVRRWRRNRGFAKAVNAGARLGGGDWLLFLNPDTSVGSGFLDGALRLAEQARGADPALGIIGFEVRNTNGSQQGSTGPFPTFFGTLARLFLPRSRRKYSEAPPTRSQVPWVTGCCLMVRRECFRQLGGFDDRFFLYYEDVDLCRRAREHGWSVWYEPALSIVHHRPLHGRAVSVAVRLTTRHSLLTYASRHWPDWQLRFLARIIGLESRVREAWASWKGDEYARKRFGLLGRIAWLLGQRREKEAHRILQQVIHAEDECRHARPLSTSLA
jgi:GT2 family glycosyltransferase